MIHQDPLIPEDLLSKYERDGFAVIEDFLSEDDIKELEAECPKIIQEEMPKALQNPSIFSTETHDNAKDIYFLESNDKIRLFFEKEAFDENGRLLVDEKLSVNKIGHALHELNQVFKKVSTSCKVKAVVKRLGFIQPAICQSMYIFKQPSIGGSDPHGLIGFWFALEDATLENGCLWAIPGSHEMYPVEQRFVRNRGEGPLCVFRGEPLQVDESKFEALPVKKGSLVLIHGCVVHKSEKNVSDNSRHAYTFHVYEQHNTTYSLENWLQPTQQMPFTVLYKS